VLSVGGGGLLRGVQLGLERVGWAATKVIAVETGGAASFAAALNQKVNQDNDGCTGPLQPVNIGAITSIATSLGALAVTPAVLEPSAIRVSTESLVVSDEDAVCACEEFLIRQRTLVEPACGAAIAAIFAPHNKRLVGMRNVVVVACGGSVVNLSLLRSWKDQLGLGELRIE
jgi:L-serine/L-threonine ammonia-lyase